MEIFDFSRTDVLRAISECEDDTMEGTEDIDITTPTLPNTLKTGTVSWVGVKDFGRPVVDPRYEHIMDATSKYRLHIGYTAVRRVTPENGDPVFIYCQVLEGDHGPLYRCSTDEDIDSDIDPCFEVSTHAKKHILARLNVNVSHNYSGHEFFGFKHSDVLHQLRCPLPDYRRDTQACLQKYPELQALMNIKIRGAGSTEGLCKKSKARRNNAIHDAVEFASFGSVKSKFYCYSFVLLYRF